MNYKGVVIDAGHGGSDGGASGNGILEKDLNLKISQYIHDRLDDLGVSNKLIRDNDVTIEPSERTRLIKDAYGNTEDVLVISNHINAGGPACAECD